MNNLLDSSFRKYLAAFCLIAAPIVLLIGDAAAYFFNAQFAFYLCGKVSLTLFVFAVFVLVDLLRPFADRLGLIAGGMAIIGAISGTTLFSLVYFYNEASKGVIDAAAMNSFNTFFEQFYLLIVMMPLPGLFFPIGLTILSVGLFWKKAVPRWSAIVLAIGAILFPVGRIPGILTISIASDIFLTISLCFIGWRILVDSQIQQRDESLIVDAPVGVN